MSTHNMFLWSNNNLVVKSTFSGALNYLTRINIMSLLSYNTLNNWALNIFTLTGSVFLSLTNLPSSITDCIQDTARSISTSIIDSLKCKGCYLNFLQHNTTIP